MMPPGRSLDFTDVDNIRDASAAVTYLDTVSGHDSIRVYKEKTFVMLQVREGQRILDIGCGAGDDVRLLALKVGGDGAVVGVDKSETMIAAARERSDMLRLPVEYRLCDAHNLDYPDNIFDGCRADRVFMHLEDPAKALSEMTRVVRQAGRVVVSEPDWETLVIDASNRGLARKILNFQCDNVRHGWIGRRLPSLFKSAGLREIEISSNTIMITDLALADRILGVKGSAIRAYEAGVLTEFEVVEWLEGLQRAVASDSFFCAITGFAAAGRKP